MASTNETSSRANSCNVKIKLSTISSNKITEWIENHPQIYQKDVLALVLGEDQVVAIEGRIWAVTRQDLVSSIQAHDGVVGCALKSEQRALNTIY